MNQDWRDENSAWAIPLAEERDVRITNAIPIESGKLTSLLVWTLQKLRAVAKDGVDVGALVQMAPRTQPERALTCGTPRGAAFIRKDGVRCHFQIVVREVVGHLELISYALHLDAPDHHGIPPEFLRWEFSATRKSQVDAMREPQAHLHPGHNRVRLPSPVLSPKELIAVFLGLELWR